MFISYFLIISKEFIQSGLPWICYKNLLKVPETSSSDNNWSSSKRTKRNKLPLFKRCKPGFGPDCAITPSTHLILFDICILSGQYVLYLMLYYIIMCIVPAVQVPFVGCLEKDDLENEDLENAAFFIRCYSQVLSNSKFLNSERHMLMNEMMIFSLL